ncbi:hypothetical protein ACJMK2_016143 [Sinanodonta woodiana]|uniref:CUB domain-containing protein n=1 Tax=Sinanodonta woodiana TaxID=1069815 RepID=A0ABD3USX2_SINWO
MFLSVPIFVFVSVYVSLCLCLCLCLCLYATYCLTPKRYMVNYDRAHLPVYVNDSLILELKGGFLSDDLKSEEFLNCQVNVITETGRRLLVHFLSLEISFDRKKPDRLHIYDYKPDGSAVRITPEQGLFGVYDYYYAGGGQVLKDLMSSTNRLKLDYGGTPTMAYSGFKILFTSFIETPGQCGHHSLRCPRKGICVSVDLWCDGLENCGLLDDSDEINCDYEITTGSDSNGTITAVVAAVASSLTFLLVLVLVGCVIFRLNKKDKELINSTVIIFTRSNRQQHQVLSGYDKETIRLCAPPAYEVAIGMGGGELPPDYKTISQHLTKTTSSYLQDDTDARISSTNGNGHIDQDVEDHVIETAKLTNGRVCVTSALVSMDQEGNRLGSGSNSSDTSLQWSKKQNNLNNISDDSPNRINKYVAISDDIEFISCEEEFPDSEEKNDDTNSSLEGADSESYKHNGNIRVVYTRSPSKREAANIEFIDENLQNNDGV